MFSELEFTQVLKLPNRKKNCFDKIVNLLKEVKFNLSMKSLAIICIEIYNVLSLFYVFVKKTLLFSEKAEILYLQNVG